MLACFDIGGTTIKCAIGPAPGALRRLPDRPTPTRDFDSFAAALAAALAEAGTRPDRVCAALPGTLDPATGIARVANIPCLTGQHVAARLSQALGLPVHLGNDADCFALAEASLGAGRGHAIVFGAILGTGVGGGLVVRGRLIDAGGSAGEWGHGPVAARLIPGLAAPLPAFPCGCGLTGCLDPIGAARGIERLHAHLTGAEQGCEAILGLWHRGDPQASRTVAVWTQIVAPPLALVVNVTGATLVPVGGGLSRDPALIAALDAATRPITLRAPDRPLVVPATCGPDAGLIGAALLAADA